jgi:hypothetical protein
MPSRPPSLNGLRLVRCLCFGAFLLGGIARALGGLLRGGERLLAALQHRDVSVDAEQAAIAQWPEVELDILARGDRHLVARAARPQDTARDIRYGFLDIFGGAKFTVVGELAENVEARHARGEGTLVIGPHLVAEAVGKLPAEILVPERYAVAHVVEDGLHDLAGALDIVARLLGRFLGGGEGLLAFLE